MNPSSSHLSDLPEAILKAERRVSWLWMAPLVALGLVAWVGYHAWTGRGIAVTVHLDQGYGLQIGDAVRYRGISVGRVDAVDLVEELNGITVRALLTTQGSRLARSGAKFWVVRPQLDVTGVNGLETLVGPRYLAVLPGNGPEQRDFIGLNDPPIIEAIEPGDLEVVLQASRRGSLRPGAPVLYRQVRVGTILSVGLTSDGGAVEARMRVSKAYRQLIRPETRFWSVGGIDAQVGIRGLSVEVDSLETLLAGGVAIATPPHAGEVAPMGYRFHLDDKPVDEWLQWAPLVAIGNSLLPPGSQHPTPIRAALEWKQGRWVTSEKSRQGWVLQTERGLLGPADLLCPDEKAREESVVLEVAGRTIAPPLQPAWTDGRLALVEIHVTDASWPLRLRRAAETPEDTLIVGDPTAPPIPVSAGRLTRDEGVWRIDSAVSLDLSWHGACVLARSDGRLVGLVLMTDASAIVAPLSPTY